MICVECRQPFECRWAQALTCGFPCAEVRRRRLYPGNNWRGPAPPAMVACGDCGALVERKQRCPKYCSHCRYRRVRDRHNAARREWHRNHYEPHRRRPGLPLGWLTEDMRQEQALAELEGRPFDLREFKRTHAPYQERSRISWWLL